MRDVAVEAGVSVSAVSKILRGAYGSSPEMRVKVLLAIEKLGYRPNAGARAMRGRSYTIGVMLVELSSPFQPEVVQGISEELEASPFQEILIAGGASAERQKRSIEALLDRQVDGLIVIAPWMESAWLEELGSRIPTVTVALHGAATSFDTVVDDDYEGARLAVDHLVSLGHRRILHTSMPASAGTMPFSLSHTARRDGYRRAMQHHDLEPDVISTWYSEEGGYEAGMEALARTERPTAIFAGADIAALGVIRAAEDHGLRVPEDLSVVGYDNIYISTVNRIALTTVDQSGRMTGSKAAQLLLARLDGRNSPAQYVIAPRLIPRSTSGLTHSIPEPAARQ